MFSKVVSIWELEILSLFMAILGSFGGVFSCGRRLPMGVNSQRELRSGGTNEEANMEISSSMWVCLCFGESRVVAM